MNSTLDILLAGGTWLSAGPRPHCIKCAELAAQTALPVVSASRLHGAFHTFKVLEAPASFDPGLAVISLLCASEQDLLPWQKGNVVYRIPLSFVTEALADAGLTQEAVQIQANYVGQALDQMAVDW